MTNAEYFECIATIDGAYFLIELAYEELGKIGKGTPVEQMINAASGYNSDKTDKIRKSVIECLEFIIENKKKIEADYEGEQEILSQINAL